MAKHVGGSIMNDNICANSPHGGTVGLSSCRSRYDCRVVVTCSAALIWSPF